MAPAALLAVATCRHGTNPRARWLFAGALVLGVLVVLAPWNGRKRFVHDVFSVREGMSVDEVETVMGAYIKGVGPKWEPPPEHGELRGREADASPTNREPEYPDGYSRRHFTGTMTYRWSTAASYDADWGQVHFVDGKVVKVEFLPD